MTETSEPDSAETGALATLVRLIADRSLDTIGHRTKVCFFLGAGADLSSGGITFAELQRQAVQEFSNRRIFAVTPPEHVEARFEELFTNLQPDERALLIESVFRKSQALRPSDAYKLLVLLAEARGIDAVVTTNFDLMLETAQAELGRNVFQVFAPGVARPYPLSHSRFELPKTPYLKLHGDLASRAVTLLTKSDLDTGAYDASMLDLLTSIVRTHDLVFVGYSGFDTALAEIIATAAAAAPTRIYWCSPRRPNPDAPLHRQLGARARVVRLGFEDLMMEVGKPVLERPSLAHTEPTYLRCLFDWRIEYCNREYLQLYGERDGKSVVDLFARRPLLEQRLQEFLLPNRPLAIVTGPSGFGKTTLGIRLHKVWRAQPTTRVLLIRSRSLSDDTDIEQYLMEQLGGLGPPTHLSVYQLERWIAENGLRLVLFIDGINEFSSDLSRCVQFMRSILRLCYFLPEHDSAIRVIGTVRQDTWAAMLPFIDDSHLRRTAWSGPSAPTAFQAIACSALSDEELSDAIARLRDHGYPLIDLHQMSAGMVDQLRDPYLLSSVAESTRQGLPASPSSIVYQRAIDAKLQKRGSTIDVATLRSVLGAIALRCLGSNQDRFREIDVEPAALRGEVVRTMKDLRVFVSAGDGFLQFDHDRTHEYCLAVAFGLGMGPSLETLEDLLQFLRRFQSQPRAIAAARLYFQLGLADRFALIQTALTLLDQRDARFSATDADLLFGFAREVLVQMTEQATEFAAAYLSDAIDAARQGRIGGQQLRTVVQSAAHLPDERAIALLTKVSHPAGGQAETEASIYAVDKLVTHYLVAGCPPIDLLRDEPYATFFADERVERWRRLGRLARFMSQLGVDNTHPEEYRSAFAAVDAALSKLQSAGAWNTADVEAMAAHLIEDADRLMFNATPDAIRAFFSSPARRPLTEMLDVVAAGATLSRDDLRTIEPFIDSLDYDVEYHLSHALAILSAFNDLPKTMAVIESEFSSFSNRTSPHTIDFYYALLVYLHIVNAVPYDAERFGAWEEVVLRDWDAVRRFRPGTARGERRGFQDPFDRFFEDGFSVVFPYGHLKPSGLRRRHRYVDYRRALAAEGSSPLPLYTKYLDEFLARHQIEDALQVLQAFGEVLIAWPAEGLLALRGVIGHPDPSVRRATIRLLAEAFNRHPDETLRFLATSGAALNEDDLVDIKIRQDARIGRRQVDEREWGRVLHYLFQRRGDAKDCFVQCLRHVLTASSYEVAVARIAQEIGLTSAAR